MHERLLPVSGGRAALEQARSRALVAGDHARLAILEQCLVELEQIDARLANLPERRARFEQRVAAFARQRAEFLARWPQGVAWHPSAEAWALLIADAEQQLLLTEERSLLASCAPG